MPNWCYNNLKITANTDAHRAALVAIMVAATTDQEIFNVMVPRPDTVFTGDFGPVEREIHGFNNWYDWNNANWGTKWDTTVTSSSVDGDTVSLSFDTAWSPPIAMYNTLVTQGFTVVADYYEPGMMFCGIWDNGDDRCYNNSDNDFFENDEDGIHLDDTYCILQEREQYDQENLEIDLDGGLSAINE